MFDLGAAELLVIVIVAVIVIGPKDMPLAMRTVGRWIGQIRRVSAHFRTGVDAMVREAELEDMEKKWKAQNEEIMKRTAVSAETKAGEPVMTGPPPKVAPPVPQPTEASEGSEEANDEMQVNAPSPGTTPSPSEPKSGQV